MKMHRSSWKLTWRRPLNSGITQIHASLGGTRVFHRYIGFSVQMRSWLDPGNVNPAIASPESIDFDLTG